MWFDCLPSSLVSTVFSLLCRASGHPPLYQPCPPSSPGRTSLHLFCRWGHAAFCRFPKQADVSYFVNEDSSLREDIMITSLCLPFKYREASCAHNEIMIELSLDSHHESCLVSKQVRSRTGLRHVSLLGSCDFLFLLFNPVRCDLQHQTLQDKSGVSLCPGLWCSCTTY